MPQFSYIFSDIHGNLPALEAVINDIGLEEYAQAHKYFLGDYVHFSPYGNEVINHLRTLKNAEFIKGNHDIYCADTELDYKAKYRGTVDKMITHIEWVRKRISPFNQLWLTELPKTIHFTLNHKSIILFHGHFEDTERKFNLSDPRLKNYDYAICGHTHKVCNITKSKIRIINAGSVGEPLDGDNRACYIILETDAQGNIDFTIKRVVYNVEEVIREASRLKMPFRDELASSLRNAKIK